MNELASAWASPGRTAWDLPGGAPAAIALAAVAALLTTLLAVRALRRRAGAGRLMPWGAAVARAAAVGAAVLAAAGPQILSLDTRAGECAVAVADGVSLDGTPDRKVRWSVDDSGAHAPDAAAALEILRAAADADEPLELVLAPGAGAPSGDAVERGLRRTPFVTGSVLGDATLARGTDLPTDSGVRAAAPPFLAASSGATEGVPVTLDIQSAGAPFDSTRASLTVGDREQVIELPAGARHATSPPLNLPAGTHLARLDVPGRGTAIAFVEVGRAPRVAYVAKNAASHPIVATLAAQGLDVTASEPRDAAMTGFANVDVIVLGPGAEGTALTARVAGSVQSGTGLLVLGGAPARRGAAAGPAADTGGLRRLVGSPVEELLPVTLPPAPPPPPPPADPPQPPPPEPPEPPPPSDDNPDVELEDGPKQALRIALLLIIDRSGSMAGPKMRMAQSSAMAAARHLAAEDRVGVLAFDDRTQWVAPFQDAGDMATLGRRIGGLRPDGGTDFFPALKEGFAEIARQRCGIRHVILLSDGATRSAVFRPTVEGASSQGITLSTVAIGDGADSHLLGLIAGWGKGRIYLATDPQRLPEVVTMDTRRFTVEERDRRADEIADKPEGLPDAPPDVGGPDDPTADAGNDMDPPDATNTPQPDEPEVVAPRIPRVLTSAALLAGLLDATWPALPHPEDMETRGVALVVLGWENDAPALVIGRSGEARVAVLAADVATQDAATLFAWDAAPAFLAQLVRSLAEPPDPSGGGVVATMTRALDGTARVALPIPAEGSLHLRPEGGGDEVVVRCSRIGGSWTAGRLAATPPAGVHYGMFVPTTDGVSPREVALVSQGAARAARHSLAELAAAADAPIVSALPDVRRAAPSERREPASAPLLGAAGILLLVEAALRRAV